MSPDGATVTIMPRYDTNQSENISFTYMIYDLQTQKWHMLQENGGTSCEWKLWAAGSYWIHIVGKTADGVETTYTMGYSVQGGAKVTGLQVAERGTTVGFRSHSYRNGGESFWTAIRI